MLELYYRIWVDFIKRAKLQPANKHSWKTMGIITMTMAMTFNFALLMIVIQRYVTHNSFYGLRLPLPEYASNVVSFLILFIIPCVIINYLLIFRGTRYKKLLEKYPYYNGKLFVAYFLTSMLLPILLMWIGIFISRN